VRALAIVDQRIPMQFPITRLDAHPDTFERALFSELFTISLGTAAPPLGYWAGAHYQVQHLIVVNHKDVAFDRRRVGACFKKCLTP
jgi:hypothetical protein